MTPSADVSRFTLFLIVGGIAALVNIVSRLLFNYVTPFEVAIVLAYVVGLTAAFVMNRRFVFDAVEGNPAHQYARFTIVNLVALLLIFVISVAMARVILPWLGWTWHAETIAHIIGVASPIVLSYYGHKHFSFR